MATKKEKQNRKEIRELVQAQIQANAPKPLDKPEEPTKELPEASEQPERKTRAQKKKAAGSIPKETNEPIEKKEPKKKETPQKVECKGEETPEPISDDVEISAIITMAEFKEADGQIELILGKELHVDSEDAGKEEPSTVEEQSEDTGAMEATGPINQEPSIVEEKDPDVKQKPAGDTAASSIVKEETEKEQSESSSAPEAPAGAPPEAPIVKEEPKIEQSSTIEENPASSEAVGFKARHKIKQLDKQKWQDKIWNSSSEDKDMALELQRIAQRKKPKAEVQAAKEIQEMHEEYKETVKDLPKVEHEEIPQIIPQYEDGGDSIEQNSTVILEEAEIFNPRNFPTLTNLATNETIIIDKPVFTIGCSEKCDYMIRQDAKVHTVSRHHATIIVRPDTTYVEDKSSNGTFIGTDPKEATTFFRLLKDSEIQVKNGQYIKFATETYLFNEEGRGE